MERVNLIVPSEVEEIKEMQRKALRLHVLPVPLILIDIDLFNRKTGKKVLEYRARAHTYVRNAYNLLTSQMGWMLNNHASTFGAGYVNMKRTNGTVSGNTTRPMSNYNQILGGAGSATVGIVIGTGTGAEDFEGYVLGTPIAHGTGAGQMSYLAMPAQVVSYNAGTKVFQVQHERSFNNDSGGDIVVGEMALYLNLYNDYSDAYICMLMRDLLSPAVTVGNGYAFRGRYKTQVTYPA